MSDLPSEDAVPPGPAGNSGSLPDVPPAAQDWAAAPLTAAPLTAAPLTAAPLPAPRPGPAPATLIFGHNRQPWLPSVVVAAIIAGVVLGGIGLDQVIASPSAGIVTVGGSVTMNAAPGWVLASPPDDTSAGIELQKADAVLTAEVVSSSYSGDSASILSDQERSLEGGSAQISYGGAHRTSVSGHDTTYVAFEATVSSGQRSGILDGELVCMVVDGNAVVIVAAAPQGDLEPVIDDVSAMIQSVGVGG